MIELLRTLGYINSRNKPIWEEIIFDLIVVAIVGMVVYIAKSI